MYVIRSQHNAPIITNTTNHSKPSTIFAVSLAAYYIIFLKIDKSTPHVKAEKVRSIIDALNPDAEKQTRKAIWPPILPLFLAPTFVDGAGTRLCAGPLLLVYE